MSHKLDMKCGLFAIVGRPNVGKSTLLNSMIHEKVSIISRKPNTTRTSVLGVHTTGQHQVIFIDTPGWQRKPSRVLDRYMNRFIDWSIEQVDCILMISDARFWQNEDKLIAESISFAPKPKVLIINKVDLVRDKSKLLKYVEHLVAEGALFDDYLFISAKKGQYLDSLNNVLFSYCPEREFVYSQTTKTDKSENFRICESIREKLLMFLGDELPYETCVVLEQYTKSKKLSRINAVIYVERESQRHIILGKKGALIKQISIKARQDLELLLGNKVYIRIWVKVVESWSNDMDKLKLLGLKNNQ